jgi:hypothetical protein
MEQSTLRLILRVVVRVGIETRCHLQALDCRTTKTGAAGAGSINFGNGIHSMRNVAA